MPASTQCVGLPDVAELQGCPVNGVIPSKTASCPWSVLPVPMSGSPVCETVVVKYDGLFQSIAFLDVTSKNERVIVRGRRSTAEMITGRWRNELDVLRECNKSASRTSRNHLAHLLLPALPVAICCSSPVILLSRSHASSCIILFSSSSLFLHLY